MFSLHFSQFKTFLFFGHSKIEVRSCVLCVYAGTRLATLLSNFQRYICMVSVFYSYRGRLENSVYLDQLPSEKMADLDHYCFETEHIWVQQDKGLKGIKLLSGKDCLCNIGLLYVMFVFVFK